MTLWLIATFKYLDIYIYKFTFAMCILIILSRYISVAAMIKL